MRWQVLGPLISKVLNCHLAHFGLGNSSLKSVALVLLNSRARGVEEEVERSPWLSSDFGGHWAKCSGEISWGNHLLIWSSLLLLLSPWSSHLWIGGIFSGNPSRVATAWMFVHSPGRPQIKFDLQLVTALLSSYAQYYIECPHWE